MALPYAEVIGDPIGHSRSPLIHKFWLGKLGIDADYRATRVTSEELAGYFGDRIADPAWRGCNISMPHKLAARSHVFYRQDPSFPLWPINLAYRDADGTLNGDDFDGPGFVMSLMKLPSRPGVPAPAFADKSGSAMILGAGGAARLIAWGLAHFGYNPIWIRNRDSEKGERFASDFRPVGGRVLPADAPTPPVDLLVNATPLGMKGQPEAVIDLDPLPAHAIVYDLVYEPAETGLLKRARERGLQTMNGLSMLIEQAAPSFHRLFGAMPPREHDAELEELLTR